MMAAGRGPLVATPQSFGKSELIDRRGRFDGHFDRCGRRFRPQGSVTESEDYQVDLKKVSILELTINPDLGKGEAIAKLADWRVA